MIEIVKATESHFSTIRDLAVQTWPHTFKDILSPAQIDYMLNMMYSMDSIQEQVQHKGHHFILAKEGSTYLGYCSYELNYKESPGTKIHKIYVLPQAQGKGVGKALMGHTITKAVQSGNTSLLLNVNRDNPAIRFYERLGFQIIDREDIDIGNGFLMEDYVMKKIL